MESIIVRRKQIRKHFDSIASQYSKELPIHYQKYLLKRKMFFILKYCENLHNKIGLDIGCGQGIYTHYLNQYVNKMVGIDFSINNVKNTIFNFADNKYAINSDGGNLPLKSNHFDFCFCINVLHHIPSIDLQKNFLDEMIRVVKPKGKIFVFDLSQKNPLFTFYLKHIFPKLRAIDEGDELFFSENDIIKLTRSKSKPIAVEFYSFLPDIVPKFIMNIIVRIEMLIEKTIFKRFAMHQVIVLKKNSSIR